LDQQQEQQKEIFDKEEEVVPIPSADVVVKEEKVETEETPTKLAEETSTPAGVSGLFLLTVFF
jgi:hypothetical protein